MTSPYKEEGKFLVRVSVMVSVKVLVSVRVRVRVEGLRALICPSESSIERVKVSHVIVECRVINHHPILITKK